MEQYSAGGTGRVKVLVIGGPGVGKTRWSSYFPKPIYLDCEGGLASVADRRVQFATIKTSQDMLEALVFLKQECMRPVQDRKFSTVVVDTIDAFQRKVKDEWLQAHPGETSFRGFDAWGYLDAKMQMLATRLLNLDMNVIVAVHYTEKTISEGSGETKSERQELQLQLSGAMKDQLFNDFDLVGWMGTYYQQQEGSRVQKRGLTFKPTHDKPFLKDRLHVTPAWMEVTFSDEDYVRLFEAVASRLDEMGETEDFGIIPDATASDLNNAMPSGGPVGPLPGGALPPQDPREVPLEQFDKVTLQKMARDLGITIKGNTLKGELIDMIKAKRAEVEAAPAAAPAEQPVAPAEAAAPSPQAAETPAPPAPEPAAPVAETPAESDASSASPVAEVETGPTEVPAEAPTVEAATSTPAADAVSAPAEDAQPAVLEDAAPATQPEPEPVVEQASAPSAEVQQTPDAGAVNTTTGEVLDPQPLTEAQAVETVLQGLGGQVISETPTAEAPVQAAAEPTPAPVAAPTPAPAANPAEARCPGGQKGCGCGGKCEREGCDNPIGPNPDFIKLSYIKYRQHLCDTDYLAKKKAS